MGITDDGASLIVKFTQAAIQMFEDSSLNDQQLVVNVAQPLKDMAGQCGAVEDAAGNVLLCLVYLVQDRGIPVADIQGLKDDIRAAAANAGHTGFVTLFDKYAPQ